MKKNNMHTRGSVRAMGLALALLVPAISHAWWNADFKQRTRITLNTSAAGVETKEVVSGLALPVRLHSGNFDFLAAKPDGSDLRFVAGDDKTPLKFSVERYDATNELALVWVQVPTIVPGSDKNVVYAYSGNDKAEAEPVPATAVFDNNTVAVFHFGEKDGVATDLGGTVKSTAAVAQEPNGLLAASARLTGTPLTWLASERLQSAPGAPVTLSLWVKPDAGTALTGTLLSQGPLSLSVAEGKLSLKLGSVQTTGGELTAATWSHVVLALGVGKLTLYVNGTQVAQVDQVPAGLALTGSISLGDGFKGLVDEFQWAATVRSADWVKLSHASQAADAKLIATTLQNGDQADGEEGGGGGYLGILIKNLTPDAKAVIGLLAMMFLVALWVIVVKARLVSVTDRDNRRFLRRFREASNVLTLADEDLPHSSLQRLYRTGLAELTKRDVSHSGKALSGASIDAVKASIDADLVREGHALNASMVWLTIAISGGPFLGLLGTVVGVMITFAAIAAAGDVNVNAIAPGIAAALLATVAGLGVAIPALFAYNYLASRIKNISSDMQIFVDEFVTRVAETYGAP